MHIVDKQLEYLKQHQLYDAFMADLQAGRHFPADVLLSSSIVDVLNWQLCTTTWSQINEDLVHMFGNRQSLTTADIINYIFPPSLYPEFRI